MFALLETMLMKSPCHTLSLRLLLGPLQHFTSPAHGTLTSPTKRSQRFRKNRPQGGSTYGRCGRFAMGPSTQPRQHHEAPHHHAAIEAQFPPGPKPLGVRLVAYEEVEDVGEPALEVTHGCEVRTPWVIGYLRGYRCPAAVQGACPQGSVRPVRWPGVFIWWEAGRLSGSSAQSCGEFQSSTDTVQGVQVGGAQQALEALGLAWLRGFWFRRWSRLFGSRPRAMGLLRQSAPAPARHGLHFSGITAWASEPS